MKKKDDLPLEEMPSRLGKFRKYDRFFEETMRSFLGDKASHIASQAHHEKLRKEWYRKALKKVIKKIQRIESTTKHQEQLAYWSEESLRALKQHPCNEGIFTLCILRLVGVLLGLVGPRPYCITTPAYFQTLSQHFTEVTIEGGDDMQDNSVSIRKNLIRQLKDADKTDFEISLVLNTSEGAVKKLRKDR